MDGRLLVFAHCVAVILLLDPGPVAGPVAEAEDCHSHSYYDEWPTNQTHHPLAISLRGAPIQTVHFTFSLNIFGAFYI